MKVSKRTSIIALILGICFMSTGVNAADRVPAGKKAVTLSTETLSRIITPMIQNETPSQWKRPGYLSQKQWDWLVSVANQNKKNYFIRDYMEFLSHLDIEDPYQFSDILPLIEKLDAGYKHYVEILQRNSLEISSDEQKAYEMVRNVLYKKYSSITNLTPVQRELALFCPHMNDKQVQQLMPAIASDAKSYEKVTVRCYPKAELVTYRDRNYPEFHNPMLGTTVRQQVFTNKVFVIPFNIDVNGHQKTDKLVVYDANTGEREEEIALSGAEGYITLLTHLTNPETERIRFTTTNVFYVEQWGVSLGNPTVYGYNRKR